MNGETRLIDTNVLVQAYTVSDDRKHDLALSVLERIWKSEGATTTLQNLCEFFFVVTRKVARPICDCSRDHRQRNFGCLPVDDCRSAN